MIAVRAGSISEAGLVMQVFARDSIRRDSSASDPKLSTPTLRDALISSHALSERALAFGSSSLAARTRLSTKAAIFASKHACCIASRVHRTSGTSTRRDFAAQVAAAACEQSVEESMHSSRLANAERELTCNCKVTSCSNSEDADAHFSAVCNTLTRRETSRSLLHSLTSVGGLNASRRPAGFASSSCTSLSQFCTNVSATFIG
mmetsp:Transcript_15435/g.39066  ORF Transcript_15435/g.39066 Transcript_15435/m.39066 type:complete len:204 (-) Transcript_15435:796-1407(-)